MSGTEKFLAGAGKAFVDIGRGARQIADRGAPTMEGLITGDKRSAIQKEIDDAREIDKPLMRTGAGVAGNIGGNVALFAPTAFIPGANTYTGAALTGAAMGALQPTSGDESRTANAAIGGAMGIGGQAIGNAIGRAMRPVASSLSPEQEALAQAAGREGIPLTAGQRTGSRPLQITESVLENLPLTSAPQLAGREAQQRAFTAAALRRAGISADAATPEVLAAQKGALGGTIGDIAKTNALDFNQGLTDRLAQIASEAGKRGKTAAEPVTTIIDNILAEVGENGSMAGQNYQAWRQTLRPLSQGGGADSHLYGQIRRALDEAFNAQMESAGSEAWKTANRQYANLKTIADAMGGAGVTPATSQIAPAQLAGSLRKSMGREGVALGKGDLNELARVGQTFVKDQIPNSGTAQRALIQGLLTGGGATAGAGTAAIMGKDPLEGAGIGAGIGAGAILGPKVFQALMNSQVGQKYLTQGAIALTPAERQALAASVRALAVGSMPQLVQP